MNTETTLDRPYQPRLDWFVAQGIEYEIHEHDPAFTVSFNAGSHRFSARVDRTRWERACNVIYADLAEDADEGPAWARS